MIDIEECQYLNYGLAKSFEESEQRMVNSFNQKLMVRNRNESSHNHANGKKCAQSGDEEI